MAAESVPAQTPPRAPHGILAAGLLAVTALVRVPIELYAASRQDFSGGSVEVLLTLVAAGVLLFVLLTLATVWLPSRLRALADAALIGLATYAWLRSGFFPGPSVSLDGGRLTADLSTGAAGLLVPLAGGLLLAGAVRRQPRVVTTVLAVLLAGSLAQAAAGAVSAWRGGPRVSDEAVTALLEWSRQGNLLIVIMDTLQADVFEDVLAAEPRLRETLDGFRFYRAASSSSPTTYLSLPAIHSGIRYDESQSAQRYYHEAIYEGSVLNRFAESGAAVTYAMSLGPCPRAVESCLSTVELGRSRGEIGVEEASRLLDLGAYRVLPDGPRRTILKRGEGPFVAAVGAVRTRHRADGDLAALERLASSSVAGDARSTVKMVHSLLTHLPAHLRPDCSTGERTFDRAGAISQARCAFRPIVTLLDRLKAEGVYDVSDILLIADHGYGFESATDSRDPKFRRVVGALNPAVLVKPAREHGPLVTSDLPLELTDLTRALCDEGGCAPTEGLRGLQKTDPERTREVFWYQWKTRFWNLARIPRIARYAVRGSLFDVGSWARQTAADYVPGTVLEFRSKIQNSAVYRGFGWGRRRPTGQPMVDPRATVSMRMEPPPSRDGELLLEARLRASLPTAPRRVRVEVNGVPVGDLTSDRPGFEADTHRLDVPLAVLRRSRETTITFTALPSDAGEDPGFALQTLALRPLH